MRYMYICIPDLSSYGSSQLFSFYLTVLTLAHTHTLAEVIENLFDSKLKEVNMQLLLGLNRASSVHIRALTLS